MVKQADLDKMDEIMFPGGRPSPVVAQRRAKRDELRAVADSTDWDNKPTSVPVAGLGVIGDCFYISAYAKAMNRQPGTIRLWEDEGTTGNSPLRGAAHRGATGGAGRRIYTRYYIEQAVQIAIETGVYDPDNAKRADWETFSKRMHIMRKEAIRLIKQQGARKS